MTVEAARRGLGGSSYGVEPVDGGAPVVMMPVHQIFPAEDNPRRDVGDVGELAESIRTQGILQPLVVTHSADNAFKLVIGHRRLAAARAAGLSQVPVLVRRFSEQERLEAMMVENLQRADLAPIEEASALRKLVDLGLSQRAIAERIGRSQAHVSRRLSLLDLPHEAVEALDTGRITIEDAVELNKLKGMPKRQRAALTEALSERSWKDVSAAVRDELEDHERAEKKAEALKELREAGIPVIDLPAGYNPLTGRTEKWLAKPGAVYYSGDELPINLKAHASEPCHAAAFVQNWSTAKGEVRYLCTDPKRHSAKGPSALKAQKPKKSTDPRAAEQREKQKRQQESTQRRHEFLRRLVAGPVQVDDLLDRALAALVQSVWWSVQQSACKLLGIAVSKGSRTDELLLEHGSRHPEETILALSVAQCEEVTWSSDTMRPYLIWLSGRGHELDEVEKQMAGLDRKPPVPTETSTLEQDDPLRPIADWEEDEEPAEAAG